MNNSGYDNSLYCSVKRLLSRRRLYILTKGTVMAALVFLVILSIASLLSFFLPNPIFYAALKTAVLIAILSGVLRFIVFPLLAKKPGADIIEELENLKPGLGDQALSALLLEKVGQSGSKSGTSRLLSDAHIKEVSGRLQSADLNAAFPLSGLKRYAIALSVLLLISVTLFTIAPGSFRGYMLSASLFPAPAGDFLELADIELTIEYPEYSKLPPETQKGGSGDVKALKGSEVSFKARPLRSFNKGKLVIKDGPSLPVNKRSGKIEARFTVLNDGVYTIVSENGGVSSREFEINVIPDSEPQVKISTPLGDYIESDGKTEIQIDYQAADDFGLTKFNLIRESETGRAEKPLAKAETGERDHSGKTVWRPSDSEPGGELIKIRVEAYDNDGISGSKAGVSNVITVKLLDRYEKHKEVLNLAGELMEEFIEILADEIHIKLNDPSGFMRSPDEDASDNRTEAKRSVDLEAISTAQASLGTRIEGSLDLLRKVIESMTEDELSDYTYFAALSNMEVRITMLLVERTGITEALSVIDVPRLGRLMDREIVEFEDDILFLDSMIKAEKLRESLRASKELLEQYSELSDMMKELEGTEDEALKEAIKQKLDQIREMLAKLAEQMSEMSAELQEGFLNPDAFQSQDMSGMMDQIMKMTEEGRTDEALEMLSKMMSNLENMMMSLQSGLQSFSTSALMPDLTRLNELIARLEGLEKEETGLKEKTEGIKESLIENPRSAEDNLRDFIEKQKKRIEEIKRNLSRAKAAAAEPGTDITEGGYLIERTIQRADELGNWLDAAEFPKALKSAKNLEESTKSLRDLGRAGIKSLTKSPQEIENSRHLAAQIRQDLEKLAGSRGQGAGFPEIADRQDEVQSETEDLAEEADDIAKELPLSPEIGQKIGEAGEYMGKASGRLEGNEISKAISNQDEAIKALQDARAKAEEMLKNFQASADGGMMPVPMALGQRGMQQGQQGVDNRYVEIPATDEETGKEFKERIMEAMKGGSPEGYGEINKKYYDRIIK